MKKKKKGSSLLLVMIVFAILSIAATSAIAMTSSDYYRRITETKRLQNLYGAESGLDITYNILAKTVESAVKYANINVQELTKTRDGKLSIIDEEISRLKNNKDVLYPDNGNCKKSRLINEDGTINREELKNIQNEKFKECFNNFINKVAIVAIQESKFIMLKEDFGESPIISKVEDFKDLNDIVNNGIIVTEDINRGEAIITVNTITDSENIKDINKFIFEIKSDFISENTDSNGSNQKRSITAKYTVAAQEYGKGVDYSTVTMEIHPLMNKTIAIDGDMNITSNTEVNGDIYVNGNSSTIEKDSIVYDKYKGGIKVNYNNENSINTRTFSTIFKVKGDIVTPKTLLIQSKSNAEIKGNIYAGNIHIGKLAAGDAMTSDSYLKSTTNNNETDGIYLSNDLSIYGDKINTEIDNFYGINDLKIYSNTADLNSKYSKAVNSSSIIINSDNIVTLKINKRAYIWGTAYINTESGYQTGESVAVKGNYIAYSDSLGKDVEFVYDRPLQLISKINGQTVGVFEKAEHIKEYFDKNKDSGDINTVVITLPAKGTESNEASVYPEGTFTVGAYITNSNIENSNKSSIAKTQNEQINPMKQKFVNNVFYMGIKSNSESALLNDFPKPDDESNIVTVNSDIDFSKLKSKNEITSDNEKVVFNKDSNKTVVITSPNSGVKNSLYDDEDKYIKIVGTKDINERSKEVYKVSGIIITAGDVIIDGDIDFTGAIIAGKNLTCQNSSDIKINENITLVRKLIAKYYDNDLSDVIKTYNNENETILPTETIDTVFSENNGPDTNFIVKDYIKSGSWTIENTSK